MSATCKPESPVYFYTYEARECGAFKRHYLRRYRNESAGECEVPGGFFTRCWIPRVSECATKESEKEKERG